MAKKNNRAIVEPITVGDKTYKPGQEDELAEAAPQWNINSMVAKGWLSGDWSDVGITAEEEAEAVAEAEAAASAPKPSRKRA